MHRLRAVLTAALLCGCSFQSFSGGRDQGLGPDDDETDTADTRPSVSGTRGVADGDGEGGEEESGPPPATTGATLPPGEDEGGRLDLGSPPATSGTDDQGTPDDCSGFSTIELDIDDATLVDPMRTTDVGGVGLAAYSTEDDAGDVEFSVDVDCPGTYFLHGYVLDPWAGVHSSDPDSYDVFWPGGSGSWFYGCQTGDFEDGWYWLPVMAGVHGQPCDTATIVQVTLAEGANAIRFHNREPEAWWGGVAAIARLVVTNDPNHAF